MMNVADNPDNGRPDRPLTGRDTDPFANRIIVRPILVREGLVDHHHPRRVELVGAVEEPALSEWHFEGAEIIRRDKTKLFVGPGMRRIHWPTLDLKGGIAVNPAHRKNPSEASVFYPGQIADAPLQFVKKIDLRLLVGIAQFGKRNFRGQNMIGIEARIDVFQPNEALEEQAGPGEKNEREGDFRDDRDVAQPVVAPARSGAAAAFLERLGQVEVCRWRDRGRVPKISPVPIATARVTSRTVTSTCTSLRRGMV